MGTQVKTGNLLEARENASDHVGIGLGFAFDWLKWRREFSRQITAQRKQSQWNPRSFSILSSKLL